MRIPDWSSAVEQQDACDVRTVNVLCKCRMSHIVIAVLPHTVARLAYTQLTNIICCAYCREAYCVEYGTEGVNVTPTKFPGYYGPVNEKA